LIKEAKFNLPTCIYAEFDMRTTFSRQFLVLGLVASITGLAHAKGLNDLAPGSGKGDEAAPTAAEPTQDHSTETAMTKSQGAPTRAYLISTSFGWAGLSNDSDSWNANGASDITLSYRLPMKVIGEAMYATFRYAPMSVAPTLTKDGEKFFYTGAVDAYHFGANTVFRIRDRITALGSAELGYLASTLKDEMGIAGHEPPDVSGVNLTVGGGADYELLPGFDIGPRLYLGFGTFSSFQFGANAAFAF
jgi:hypothetical protein